MGVGFANAHIGAFHDVLEVFKMEVFQDGLDVAVEIADQHEGVFLCQRGDDGTAHFKHIQHILITIVCHGITLNFPFRITHQPNASVDEVLGFEVTFDGEQVKKVMFSMNVWMLCQRSFGCHIACAELFLADRNVRVSIAFPQHFAPMKGVGVYGASVVEYDSLNSIYHLTFTI